MIPKTKRVLRIVMPIIAIVCAIVFVPWILVKALIMPLPDTVQEQVNAGIEYGLDGMIVYVDEGGKQPVFYTAGWKNRENKIPTDPHALFKIASITKLYVAVATTKLINAQQLSLDERLIDHLPELEGRIENADKITLRLLLQHRSGIPDFMYHPDFPWDAPPKNRSETLKYGLDLPAKFKPDAKYAYSNTNYLLLTQIMDKVLGYNHNQYIKEAILEPLELKNTFASLHEVDTNAVMSGYYVGYDPDIKTNFFGLMIATAEDVGIFLRALNDGSLLSEEEQAIYSSVYKYEHTGLLPGYQSFAKYYKDIDTVVIQFVNTSGGVTWSISEIVNKRIAKILRRKKSS